MSRILAWAMEMKRICIRKSAHQEACCLPSVDIRLKILKCRAGSI